MRAAPCTRLYCLGLFVVVYQKLKLIQQNEYDCNILYMKYYVCAKFRASIVFGYRVMPSESEGEDEEF